MQESFLSGAHERLRDASQLWTIYAAAVLLAYGFAMFNLVLVGDDWQALQANFQTDFVISIGRWMDAIIWYVANDDNFAAPLTLSVLAAAYFVFAAACCLCLGMKRRHSYLIFACVLLCFPFNAEPFAFKNMHLVFAFAVISATVSGIMMVRAYELLIGGQAAKSGALGAGAPAAFALSGAAYQTHALLAAALVLARSVGMLREPRQGAQPRSIALLLGFSALIVGPGILLYFASAQVASRLTGIPLKAGGKYAIVDSFVTSWHELFRQIYYGLILFRDLLFQTQHLFPLATKLVFLLMTAALVAVVAFDFDNPSDFWQRKGTAARDGMMKAAVLVGVVALLFLAPLSLGALRQVSQYRYNNLIGVAVPYAIVFSMLFDILRDARFRMVVATMSIAVIAIFIFEQNRASITSFLLNRRDLTVAGQMLDRITADPAFAPFAAKGEATILFYGRRLENRILPRPFSVDGIPAPFDQRLRAPLIVSIGV